MSENFGFSALFPARRSVEVSLAQVELAARESGLVQCVTVQGTAQPRASYETRGLAPLTVTFQTGSGWHQFGIYPVSRETFQAYGPETIGAFLKHACLRLDVVLGRSFKEDLHAVVYEREIEGPLEYLEWFQYLGPAIVSRWGAEYLQQGPFHRVEMLPGGACALWLRPSPYDQTERESTKRGAEYLRLKIRPHFIRESDGSLVELRWP